MAKSKVAKITLSAVGAITLMSLSNVASAKSVNEIIKEYYPIYNKAQQCQGIIAPSGPYNGLTGEREFTGYCIEIDRQRVLETDKGKRLYIVVKGNASFNEDGEALEYTDTRFDSGLVGMLVLKPQGSSWQVESANPTMTAGSFGFGLSKWRLQKFGPNAWGFLNKHGDTHQGYTSTSFVILTPNGRGIMESWIGASFDSGGSDGCGGQGQRLCNDRSADLEIDTSKTVNGFYPLKLTVNGYNQGKTYKNSIFSINYQKNKGYIEPNEYPLKDNY